jgi:DNA-binding response OmpR family regulator
MEQCSQIQRGTGAAPTTISATKPLCDDIVLIEQDENVRRNLSSVLHGYCRNLFSFDALKPAFLHLKHRRVPSIVVTDLYLPDGPSIDLIRSCLQQSQVIVISNRASLEEAFLLGKMGVKSYFGKPFDAGRLNSVIEQSLDASASDDKLTINTFGGLSILRNGSEIQFSRKTPYKILEFIACVLSLGGRNVPVSRICDRLWPDAEGDKAERSLTASLRRTRDLLDPDGSDVLLRSAGKISFNPEKVAIDFWCFDSALQENMGRANYARDHFLQQWLPEYDHQWLIAARNEYQSLGRNFF